MAEANGIMAFWADIDADCVTEYRRWHNCEHMLERIRVCGQRSVSGGAASVWVPRCRARTGR
jgi:hypothetical protein